jgi:hypothetical protein
LFCGRTGYEDEGIVVDDGSAIGGSVRDAKEEELVSSVVDCSDESDVGSGGGNTKVEELILS